MTGKVYISFLSRDHDGVLLYNLDFPGPELSKPVAFIQGKGECFRIQEELVILLQRQRQPFSKMLLPLTRHVNMTEFIRIAGVQHEAPLHS